MTGLHLRPPGFRAGVLLLLLAPAMPGCGSSGPAMGKVRGAVTYKGAPVPKGTITFVSDAPGGPNATGQIGPDGTYRIQTTEPGDGAPVGDYHVTVYAHDDPILDYIPRKKVPPKLLVPAKYEKAESSGLKATVKAGSNTVDFPLEG